jgi:hypothetical protein
MALHKDQAEALLGKCPKYHVLHQVNILIEAAPVSHMISQLMEASHIVQGEALVVDDTFDGPADIYVIGWRKMTDNEFDAAKKKEKNYKEKLAAEKKRKEENEKKELQKLYKKYLDMDLEL